MIYQFFLTFLVVDNDKKEYSGRYDYYFDILKYYEDDERFWVDFVVKKIAANEETDCGLYCEEYNICDFFVHSGSSPCYLGTFRNRNLTFDKNGYDLVGSRTGLGRSYNIYPVYKSKF